ncbi:MAG: HNH endonuclease, partial [Marinobacter sp.]|uniref:group II intron reverse transcriptase n=1 Tax=Marinobacter sp. TaxID=50741 RepID=UPI0029C17C8E
LAPKTGAQWILEADIKGFFDNINHDWLSRNVCMDKVVLSKWLKAGVIDRQQCSATTAGTPQGGIISPCLANATLNGLETQLKNHLAKQLGKAKARKRKVQVIRYADDFVVLADSKELLEDVIKPWIERFLAQRGVELSQAKTHLTHITDGFDFLGWNFRKYVPKSPYRKPKLLIKPSKKNAQTFYRRVSEVIKSSGALTQEALIAQLNPILRGWANYHSPVVAKQTFSKLENLIFWRLWRWAKRRHPKKSADWISKKYFHHIGGRKRVFAHPYINRRGERAYRELYHLPGTPIMRHKRLPVDYQPYDVEHELKWETLRVQRQRHKLRFRKQIMSLYIRQQGLCALCGHSVTEATGWHDHHIIRRVDGGPDTLQNRVLLHPNCHAQVHSQGGTKVTLKWSGIRMRSTEKKRRSDQRLT